MKPILVWLLLCIVWGTTWIFIKLGLVLARIYIGEEITGLKVISILLGMLCVAVIFYEQLSLNGNLALFGSLAIVVGAFGAAYASVLTKSKLQGFNPATMVFCQML